MGEASGAGSTRAVTLRDVAQLAGVHPGTVSRALNEATRPLVNAETTRRVLDAAEKLKYRPNPIARGLKTNRSRTVGVIVPDLLNPLFAAIVRGIEARLDRDGYTLLITNTDNDPDRERTQFEAMLARQVDGFITATAHRDHRLITEVVGPDAKVVLVNRRADDNALPAVTVDDERGVRLTVAHLVELGHRRIAQLSGPSRLSTGMRRRQGFVAAMAERGLDVDPELLDSGDGFTEAEGARVCRDLIGRGVPFTAIVAGNDLMALGCLDALDEVGLRCPEDVSIVGFNDIPFAGRFRPPLTTVRIPHYELGATAGGLLLDMLRGEDVGRRQILLDPELIVRESTAPPAP
ncbi:MAG TPA: LacI family DNA-binding transcriptional regulator [Streptosporangiaceae bacterium]|jgi:LacI family transcriptional regulator